MTHLIDKDALVAEIERLYKVHCGKYGCDEVALNLGYLEDFLDTIEVKEVDLEKEIDFYIETSVTGTNPIYTKGAVSNLIERTAKHFFELGMRVNNPTTAADRGTAGEIIINLKRVEQDYRINLTKEIEWVRNKVKK